eukprot:8291005-Heterocapsa_arctica.AAC.1
MDHEILAQCDEDSIGRYNKPGRGTTHVNKGKEQFGAKFEDEKTRESRRVREGEEGQREGEEQQGK